MTKLINLVGALIFVSLSLSAAAEKESPQVASIRSMHRVLVAGKYGEFYRDWCHPNIQRQMSGERFGEWMRSEQGKAVVRLYAEVLRAVDAGAAPDVLIAQPQAQPDQYEFILVAVRKKNAAERAGSQWHLELQLHGGKWKLLDTD